MFPRCLLNSKYKVLYPFALQATDFFASFFLHTRALLHQSLFMIVAYFSCRQLSEVEI